MQHRPREPAQAPQRARRVEIADYRRQAFGAQLSGTFGACRQGDDARSSGTREQALRAAQSDVAASDDEHARPAQDSCGVHVGAL
jgi:hypothetical protein